MAHISQLLFKFVLYLSLTLLNSLSLLNGKKIKLKKINYNFFNISQKYLKKKINFCPRNLGPFSSRGGPRQWPKWLRPRVDPNVGVELVRCILSFLMRHDFNNNEIEKQEKGERQLWECWERETSVLGMMIEF